MDEVMQRTLAMIKPDAVAAGHVDEIVDRITANKFVIIHRRQLQLSKEAAEEFYKEHCERDFFGGLTDFMSSGPIVALALAKEDAITEWRSLMGPTDSNKARAEKPESLRALFGTNGQQNATHGSDSPESAARELKFFFPNMILEPLLYGPAARDYLEEKINPVLTGALKELCKEKPADPITWLGNFLLDNNPNKPRMYVAGSEAKNKIVFVLGGPGSGKGTQCAKLVEEFGFIHLSAGDLLRAEVQAGSADGDMIADCIKEGKIVPQAVTIRLLRNAMAVHTGKTFLIDGFPRAVDQALSFEEEVGSPEFVLFYDCPEEILQDRLLKRGETSGRSDDNIEAIRKRFETYKSQTMPVIAFYEQQYKVRKLSSADTPDAVYNASRALFR
eukprot:GFYU01006206.1.p1 GENE.GFYU01006206.1~~GFYU01006206.1.p1  ORF type:complete len:388 (-),score=125.96 GFYU01006206.1:426-1589(-)